MLKALIRQKERERLELESQLSKAQSSASTTGFGSGAGLSSPQHQQQKQPHQQPALSISTLRPHPLNENGVNGPSRSSTMPHRATPTLGLTAKQARQVMKPFFTQSGPWCGPTHSSSARRTTAGP
jgi:hypothetical protein